MKPALAAILALWLISLDLPARAGQKPTLFQDHELTIVGDSRLLANAGYLGQIYPQTKADLEKAFGWKLLSKPMVFLTGDRGTFEQLSGSPYVSAFAVPSQSYVVLLISPETAKPYVLNETFKHELCHLLLHDHITKTTVSRWLDEGVCQWASGSLGEILSGEAAPGSRIDMALRFIPLRELADGFPGDKVSLSLAYRESRDFVTYLTARYGSRGLLAILRHLEEGESVDAAFRKALPVSFENAQAAWREDMQGKNEWLIWASRNLYELVFFAAAVLAVIAFVRIKVSRTHCTDEEEDSD